MLLYRQNDYFRDGVYRLGLISVWDISLKRKINETIITLFYPRVTVFSSDLSMVAYVSSNDTVIVQKLELEQ
jgi:hypothetical protein